MNRTKFLFKFIFIVIFTLILVLVLSSQVFAATPKIVSKLSDAFDDIESWLLKLSTPAAAVAVGVGLFMKKFSFGDEERIRIAKKVIRGSLISYALLLSLNMILNAIESLIN